MIMKKDKVEMAKNPLQSVSHDGASAVHPLLLPSRFEMHKIEDAVKMNVSTQCVRAT